MGTDRQITRSLEKVIKKDQALTSIKYGEFGDDVISSAETVAVILTQSWCPQWHGMKGFVSDFTEADIWLLEYDLTDYFETFRRFKEQVLGNDQIPYVRYYADGVFIAESNAVSEQVFRTYLGK